MATPPLILTDAEAPKVLPDRCPKCRAPKAEFVESNGFGEIVSMVCGRCGKELS